MSPTCGSAFRSCLHHIVFTDVHVLLPPDKINLHAWIHTWKKKQRERIDRQFRFGNLRFLIDWQFKNCPTRLLNERICGCPLHADLSLLDGDDGLLSSFSSTVYWILNLRVLQYIHDWHVLLSLIIAMFLLSSNFVQTGDIRTRSNTKTKSAGPSKALVVNGTLQSLFRLWRE